MHGGVSYKIGPLFAHPFCHNLSLRNGKPYARWLWQQWRIHMDLEAFLPEACDQSDAVKYLFDPPWMPVGRLLEEARALKGHICESSLCRATYDIHDMIYVVSDMSPLVFAGVTYAFRYIHDVVFEWNDADARDVPPRNRDYWDTFHCDLDSLGAERDFRESVISGVVIASGNIAKLWSEIIDPPSCRCRHRSA